MSTRCRIGLLNEDNTVTSIYCHWDGYPSYMMSVLEVCYDTKEKITKLFNLGDLSFIGKVPESNKEQWFNPDYNLCCSYRDRGEDDVDAKTHSSIQEFKKSAAVSWCEYVYLFNNGSWEYSKID